MTPDAVTAALTAPPDLRACLMQPDKPDPHAAVAAAGDLLAAAYLDGLADGLLGFNAVGRADVHRRRADQLRPFLQPAPSNEENT